jgi:hypothetical protein
MTDFVVRIEHLDTNLLALMPTSCARVLRLARWEGHRQRM